MEAIADGAEGVEIGEAGGGEVVAVAGTAGVDGLKGRETEFEGGALIRVEGGVFDGPAFFGWTVEGAGDFETESVAGVNGGRECVQPCEEGIAVGHAGDAQIELGFGEIGDDVGRGAAAADVADIEHDAGEFVGDAVGGDEKFGEGGDGIATGARGAGGVGGAAVAGGDEVAGALARVDEVAVGAGGLVDEAEGKFARGTGGFEERATAEGADFFVGREQDLVAEAGDRVGGC